MLMFTHMRMRMHVHMRMYARAPEICPGRERAAPEGERGVLVGRRIGAGGAAYLHRGNAPEESER